MKREFNTFFRDCSGSKVELTSIFRERGADCAFDRCRRVAVAAEEARLSGRPDGMDGHGHGQCCVGEFDIGILCYASPLPIFIGKERTNE